MSDLANESTVKSALSLLTAYSFEHSEANRDQLMDRWLRTYPTRWIRLALIEALYQGRYKAVSVEQILAFWKRRGQPLYHFNHEFERLVCHNFPKNLQTRPAQGLVALRCQAQAHSALLPLLPSSSELHPADPATEPQAAEPSTAIAASPSEASPDIAESVPSAVPLALTTATPEPELEPLSLETVTPVPPSFTPPLPSPSPSSPSKVAVWSSPILSRPEAILQFTPDNRVSDFYTKLSAIALAERNRPPSQDE